MSNRLLAGRYELIEKIGEGGMAVVYKARCRLLNRYVAIKILRPEFTKDEDFIENFKKESQAAAGLSHPNIVSVYDVGKEGNIHFIVMELVEGKTLSEIIEEKGRLDYKEAIKIARQVASALSLAHKNQIIHRDVKPHNILITNTGVAKLADFGIAKAVSNSTLVGGSNKVMGSVHYLSPEQARGSYVDERTDIYSLGIVLYEMLTGKVPFDGDNPISIALMHINDPMTPPSRLTSGIPPQLEKIIMKATDKYQNNRYRTADEMIEELDNIDFITKVIGNPDYITNSSSGEERPARSELTRSAEYVQPEKERSTKGSNQSNGGGKKKTAVIVLICVSALIIIAGIIGLGAMLGWFDGSSDDIELPDLKGYTFDQAKLILEEKGLQIAEGERVYSPDQEEGKITSQSPSAGSVVKPGKLVTVNISLGKKDGIVPKVLDMDYNAAKDYLESLGFEIGMATKITNELPEGTIITQDPAAGTPAKVGTEINVEISDGKGEKMVKMPSLIGKTADEARAAIEGAGLTVGEAKYEENTDVAVNLVIYQQYPEGTELAEKTPVSYTLSKEPEVIVPPEEEGEQGDAE